MENTLYPAMSGLSNPQLFNWFAQSFTQRLEGNRFQSLISKTLDDLSLLDDYIGEIIQMRGSGAKIPDVVIMEIGSFVGLVLNDNLGTSWQWRMDRWVIAIVGCDVQFDAFSHVQAALSAGGNSLSGSVTMFVEMIRATSLTR